MVNYNLVSEILKGQWLIDEQTAHSYYPVVDAILHGHVPDLSDFSSSFDSYDRKSDAEIARTMAEDEINNGNPDVFRYYLRAIDGKTGRLVSRVNKYDDLPENSIAVLPNMGVMMKSDQFCGPMGTGTMRAMIDSADRSPKIAGIILQTDSPGGMVAGTEDLAQTIKNTSKPIVTFVDGLMASAAYWAGSAADHIISSGKSAMIGSIGTMVSIMDVQPYYEEMGVKFHDVRADKSKDKNEDFYQLLKGNYEPVKQNMLNPLNEVFLDSVKNNRDGKLVDAEIEDVLTGKVYLSEDAIKYGLVDAEGSFQDAIDKVYSLAGIKKDNYFYNSNTGTMKLKTTWLAILAFLGFSNQVAEEDLPDMKEDHLEKLNAELDRLNTELKTAQDNNAALDVRIAELETELSNEQGAHKATTDAFEAFKKEAAADPSISQSDDAHDGGSAGKGLNVQDAPWNKEARERQEKLNKKTA